VAINPAGQVVGYATTAADEQSHAFLWHHGVMTDLGTLGGTYSGAVAINPAGQVVGTASTADEQYHAFVWQDGVMTDLGSLGDSRKWGGAREMANRVGQPGAEPGRDMEEEIGGRLVTALQHCSRSGRFSDCFRARFHARDEDRGPSDALAISPAGQVVGNVFVATDGDSTMHAVLWTPR
jgi:probable HAF family extracellular repeat protein